MLFIFYFLVFVIFPIHRLEDLKAVISDDSDRSKTFYEDDHIFVQICESGIVKLIGSNLDKVKNISLTLFKKSTSDDCNDQKFPIYFNFTNTSTTHDFAFIEMKISDLAPSNEILFFCFQKKEDNNWKHQGNNFAIKFDSKSKKFELWIAILIIIFLMSISACYTGLNIGLMTLSIHEIKLLMSSGTRFEQKCAKEVYEIRKKGNQVLCSIIFGNALANTCATVIINNLTSKLNSIIISSIVIVLFVELIPQTLCSRFGLQIGAFTSSFTQTTLFLTFPISYPLGKLLNILLKDETPRSFNRNQIMELLKLSVKQNLEKDEYDIISGGLQLRTKTVYEIMTPLKNVFMLSDKAVLDFETISDIVKKGYSRIPVFSGERTNIVGVIFLRDITFIDTEDDVPVTDIVNYFNRPIIKVMNDVPLNTLLKEFKTGIGSLAIVVKEFDTESLPKNLNAIGIVTLEDIVEEIIQSQLGNDKKMRNMVSFKTYQKPQTSFPNIMSQNSSPLSRYPQDLTRNMISMLIRFLQTSIKAFSPVYAPKWIINDLLLHHGVLTSYKDVTEDIFLYKNGVTSEVFTLIIKGTINLNTGYVEVSIGKENLMYIDKALSHYGESCLEPELALSSLDTAFTFSKTFVPDFTVKIIGSVTILQISSTLYSMAIKSANRQIMKRKPSFRSPGMAKLYFKACIYGLFKRNST